MATPTAPNERNVLLLTGDRPFRHALLRAHVPDPGGRDRPPDARAAGRGAELELSRLPRLRARRAADGPWPATASAPACRCSCRSSGIGVAALAASEVDRAARADHLPRRDGRARQRLPSVRHEPDLAHRRRARPRPRRQRRLRQRRHRPDAADHGRAVPCVSAGRTPIALVGYAMCALAVACAFLPVEEPPRRVVDVRRPRRADRLAPARRAARRGDAGRHQLSRQHPGAAGLLRRARQRARGSAPRPRSPTCSASAASTSAACSPIATTCAVSTCCSTPSACRRCC